MQLLERLQKTEGTLQKLRDGESDPAEENQKSATEVTLSAEVAEKLDDIDMRMNEIKHDLHLAKNSCLKDLFGKLKDQFKSI